MRIGGLDVGDRTIGVALSDELGWTAQGLEVIPRRDSHPGADLARLAQIASQYGVERWVVGLPKNMNGSMGPRAELTVAFADRLREVSGLPVELWDERLTTAAAQRVLLEADLSRKRRRQVVDKVAAVLILQGYLAARSARQSRERPV